MEHNLQLSRSEARNRVSSITDHSELKAIGEAGVGVRTDEGSRDLVLEIGETNDG